MPAAHLTVEARQAPSLDKAQATWDKARRDLPMYKRGPDRKPLLGFDVEEAGKNLLRSVGTLTNGTPSKRHLQSAKADVKALQKALATHKSRRGADAAYKKMLALAEAAHGLVLAVGGSSLDRMLSLFKRGTPEARVAALYLAFNQENPTELLNQLVKVLNREGLSDALEALNRCKIPRTINDAWAEGAHDRRRKRKRRRASPMRSKTAKADVTPVRQRTQFTCMSTSMMMCLRAQGLDVDEDTVNRVMGAAPMRGASWEDAIACAQHFGMRVHLICPATVKQVKEFTDAGTPVMIAWNPEGREWSHASVVFDVDKDMNVHVADPNIPDPDETVRVVPKSEFYGKWSEKWPNYLVRRPAMAIEREITPDGKQVTASTRTAAELPGRWETVARIRQILKGMRVNILASDLKRVPGGYRLYLTLGEGRSPLDSTLYSGSYTVAQGSNFARGTNSFGLSHEVRSGLWALYGAFAHSMSAKTLGPEAAPIRFVSVRAWDFDENREAHFTILGDYEAGRGASHRVAFTYSKGVQNQARALFHQMAEKTLWAQDFFENWFDELYLRGVFDGTSVPEGQDYDFAADLWDLMPPRNRSKAGKAALKAALKAVGESLVSKQREGEHNLPSSDVFHLWVRLLAKQGYGHGLSLKAPWWDSWWHALIEWAWKNTDTRTGRTNWSSPMRFDQTVKWTGKVPRPRAAGYKGNPDGQDIYQNEVGHGYGEPLAGGSDIMRQTQNRLLYEQGRPQRPDSPRVAGAERVAARWTQRTQR